MSKNITIKELGRVTRDGEYESLNFESGINIVQGESGTGKTVWLKMLDFLLGDRDNIEKALGQDGGLIEKYVSVECQIMLGEDDYTLTRTWNEQGNKGKIQINHEEYVNASDFSSWILEKLEIPRLKFPRGNPYLNTWPELSFRIMYRHIFRQERFWGDIADKQPDFEQFAALSQFLGFAENIFSVDFDKSVSKNKDLLKLESRKEQYEEVLDSITRSMTSYEDEKRLTVATSSDIGRIISELEAEVQELLNERKGVIKEKFDELERTENLRKNKELELIEKRNGLFSDMSKVDERLGGLKQRLTTYIELRNKIKSEIGKLKRTAASDSVSDLKVSHCPVCDQELEKKDRETNSDDCYLCHRPIEQTNVNYFVRLEFEIHQLESEEEELEELRIRTQADIRSLEVQRLSLEEQLRLIERQLKPFKQKLSALTDDRLSSIDSQRGRIEEKIENFRRLQQNIKSKEKLTKEIDSLNAEISEYEKSVESLSTQVPYESIAESLEEGMNSYINQLNQQDSAIWPHGRIQVNLNEKRFDIRVGSSRWTTISALRQEYLLLAYHYGLLRLSNDQEYDYPGLFICDFPPQFGVGQSSLGNLNYVVQPFIDLYKESPNKAIQVIFSGKQLHNLKDSNLIHLEHIWDEGE